MNVRLAIAPVALAFATWANAQNTMQPPAEDSLMDLVAELQTAKSGRLNEITVVLPPPSEESADDEKTSIQPADENEETDPHSSEESTGHEVDAQVGKTLIEDAPQEPETGLAVRVERLQAGTSEIDPEQVKLLAPFPAKLLARSPEGWRVEASDDTPPFTREIEISPGKQITLSVRPHLLVAEAAGSSVFEVEEPGFDPALGYRQNATVGAILATSIRQLETDSRQLGTAIENLQQLLVSLPKPAPDPAPDSEIQPASKRKQ